MATIILLSGIFVALLFNSRVQDYLVSRATGFLSEMLGTQVSVDFVSIDFPNKISLEGVYVEDQQGDTLLHAQKLNVSVRPLALLQRRVELSQMELIAPDLRLVRNEEGVNNFQFIIDAFPKNSNSNIKFRFRSVRVRYGQCTFDDKRFQHKEQGFDPHHFAISDFNTNLLLETLTNENIALALSELTFEEQCGFKLKNLSFSLKGDTAQAKIEDLILKMPHSELSLQPITLHYGSFENLKKNPEQVKFDFKINPSSFAFSDFSCFVPAFSRLPNSLELTTDIGGSLANLQVKNLKLNYEDVQFLGDFSLLGLPDWQQTMLYANIKSVDASTTDIQNIIANWTGKPFLLPFPAQNLGQLHYAGNISGFFSDLVAFGSLSSNLGVVSVDMLLKFQSDFTALDYSGSVQATDLKPNILLPENTDFDNVSFTVSSSGKIRKNGFKGNIDGKISSLTFKDYTYQPITLKGDFDHRIFNGKVAMDDPNAQVNFDGKVDFARALPTALFNLQVGNLNLHRLHLTPKYPDLNIGFAMNINFAGENMDNTDTDISIENVQLQNKDLALFLKQINIQSTIKDTVNILTIDSDLLNGTVRGEYSLLNIAGSVQRMFYGYFPALSKTPPPATKKQVFNDFVFYLSDFNINKLTEILDLPLSLSEESTILGFYNDRNGKFHTEVNLPELIWNNSVFTETYLICNNPNRTFDLQANTKMNDKMALKLQAQLVNDSVYVDFNWDNPGVLSGQLHTLSQFERDEANQLMAKFDIFPSKINLGSSQWNLTKSSAETDFKSVKINRFAMEHDRQFLRINGTASSSMDDEVLVNLSGVQLGYIMQLVRLKGVSMDASLTGTCRVQSAFKEAALSLDVLAKDYTFNGYPWGDVQVNSYWDKTAKQIVAKALLYNTNSKIADLLVTFSPERKYLDFRSDVHGLPLEFLRRYTDGIIDKVSGKGSGQFNITGNVKDLDFTGSIFVEDGRFEVDFLKSGFHFNDTVHLLPDEIRFVNIPVFDKENHRGIFSGSIKHRVFKNLTFDLNIDANNILALNTTEHDNTDFYGKAYGTGRVHISNQTGATVFNISARTEAGTRITIPIGSAGAVTQNSFIRFVTLVDTLRRDSLLRDSLQRAGGRNRSIPVPTTTPTRIILQIEATPEAEIVLITDPVGGDRVRATGRGNMRVEYDSRDNMKLFGTYEVEEGDYLFTLQQVARRNFILKKGGTISWSGEPTEAVINLDAAFPVQNVSLLNILDETQLTEVSRRSVAVNCLLNLTNNLMHPDVKFDIEIPSNPEVQMRVKNIVNTDEMMNRQILALLVMGQFFKPDNMQTGNRGALSSEMVSVVTTAVSGQLNSWLSAMSGDKFNLGLNARFGNGEDVSQGGEYGVNLMWQPSPRWVINSTVGYNNDILNTSGSNFVGDIDVEYKLTRSGKLRAKAYFHSSDNYYYISSGTTHPTQGLGLIYREDFDTAGELWRTYFPRKNRNKTDSIK